MQIASLLIFALESKVYEGSGIVMFMGIIIASGP